LIDYYAEKRNEMIDEDEDDSGCEASFLPSINSCSFSLSVLLTDWGTLAT
jgi:hypothetical protein